MPRPEGEIITLIQARMGSSRLPGKTMMPLTSGKSALELMLERVSRAESTGEIVVIIPDTDKDLPIAKLCGRLGFAVFAGSEDDVLDRMYQAASTYGKPKHIIRLTADCVLHDPAVIDAVVECYLESDANYGSNADERTFPDGLDVEVFEFGALEAAWREAVLPSDREHPTRFIRQRPERFKRVNYRARDDHSELRWTLDEPCDFEFLKAVYRELYHANPEFDMFDVLRLLADKPELAEINAGITRNEGTLISLRKDAELMAEDKFVKCRRMLSRALKVTPLGSQTFSKSHRYMCGPNAPYFAAGGEGPRFRDLDDNEFIDYILGLGAITVGYNNPEVNAAAIAQITKGSSFSVATALEVELAEKLVAAVPCAEMVRLVKNGGDATAAAVRLARAATGREIIAVCGYHGMQDWYISSTDLDAGVPKTIADTIARFEYNQPESLRRIFSAHPGRVAAVILEPVQADGDQNGFLRGLREMCDEEGSVLIFDEVVSGFRYALGGGQELYGITPDLAAVGKGMANGFGCSAVVGKAELLKLIEEGVFISTTFGGESVSIAAALKTIEILSRPGNYEHIWRTGEAMMTGIRNTAAGKGMTDVVRLTGLPPHFILGFQPSGSLSSLDLLSVFHKTMLDNGIFARGAHNLSLAHGEKETNQYLSAFNHALDAIAGALNQNSVENILDGKGITPIFKRN